MSLEEPKKIFEALRTGTMCKARRLMHVVDTNGTKKDIIDTLQRDDVFMFLGEVAFNLGNKETYFSKILAKGIVYHTVNKWKLSQIIDIIE